MILRSWHIKNPKCVISTGKAVQTTWTIPVAGWSRDLEWYPSGPGSPCQVPWNWPQRLVQKIGSLAPTQFIMQPQRCTHSIRIRFCPPSFKNIKHKLHNFKFARRNRKCVDDGKDLQQSTWRFQVNMFLSTNPVPLILNTPENETLVECISVPLYAWQFS